MEEGIGLVKFEQFDPENFMVIKTEHADDTTEDVFEKEEGRQEFFTKEVSNFGPEDEVKTEQPFYYFEEGDGQEDAFVTTGVDVKNEEEGGHDGEGDLRLMGHNIDVHFDDNVEDDNDEDAAMIPIVNFTSPPSPSNSSDSNYAPKSHRKRSKKSKPADDDDSSEEYLPSRRVRRKCKLHHVSPSASQTDDIITRPKFRFRKAMLTTSSVPDGLEALEKERVRLEIKMKFGSICENIMQKKSGGVNNRDLRASRNKIQENMDLQFDEQVGYCDSSFPKHEHQRKQRLPETLSMVNEKFVEVEVPGFPNIVGFDFDMLTSIKLEDEQKPKPLVSEILIDTPTTMESLEEPVQFVPTEYHEPEKYPKSKVSLKRLKLSLEAAARNESKLTELSDIYSAVDGVTKKFPKSLSTPTLDEDNNSAAGAVITQDLIQKKRASLRKTLPKFPIELVATGMMATSTTAFSGIPYTSTEHSHSTTKHVKPRIKKAIGKKKNKISNNDPLLAHAKKSDKPRKNLILMSEIAKKLIPAPTRCSPSLFLESQEDIKSSIFTCWKCGSQYPLRAQLNKHIKRIHRGSTSKRTDLDYYYSKIEKANKIIPDKKEKEATKKAVCSWMFKCSICGTRRRKWITIKRHLDCNHKGENGKVVSNHLAGPGTLIFKCLYCSAGNFCGYRLLLDHLDNTHPELSTKSSKKIHYKCLTLPRCSVYLTNIREKKNKIASILQSIVSSMNMVNTEVHKVAPSGNANDDLPLIHEQSLDLYLQQPFKQEEDISFEAIGKVEPVEVVHISSSSSSSAKSSESSIFPTSSSSNKSLNRGCVSSSSEVINFESDFECKLCGKKFNHLTVYNRHQRLHEEKDSKLVCCLCNEQAGSSQDLMIHYQVVHGSNTGFVIKTEPCSSSNSNEGEMTKVIKPKPELKRITRSNSRRSIVDDSADNRPTKRAVVDKSAKIIKEETEELPCLLCNEKFYNSKELIVHYGVHTGENVE